MSASIKNQKEILKKLRIDQLNEMQLEAQLAIHSSNEVMLLSPTGTGKTVAFLLPVIAELDRSLTEIQAVIIVPSRELAIQIEQVMREMGTGFKANAVYGGRAGVKDKLDLKHPPAVLIGTPGRIADHIRRKTFETEHIAAIVLDEFDKSLEVGFEKEMSEIIKALWQAKKKVLTSATQGVKVPEFIQLNNPVVVNHLGEQISRLQIKKVLSPSKDKLQILVETIHHLGNQPGIVFCNFKDSIQRVSDFLKEKKINHGCFYGGMEQQERERALIKFRNGTHQLLIATDLAARGIDVPEIQFIIHYHLPLKSEEFTHRNGRTARMHQKGTAYVLQWKGEVLPDFIGKIEEEVIQPAPLPGKSDWTTLFISGGRRDKISKGDIAGLFFKQGKLSSDQLGVIELKQDCAFAAVKTNKVNQLVPLVNNSKLKKKKVRIHVI